MNLRLVARRLPESMLTEHDLSIEQPLDEQRWTSSVRTTLAALEARVGGGSSGPLTVSLYGSADVALAMIQAVQMRPRLRDTLSFVAFVSSATHRKAPGLYGLPWETTDWLAANPTDIVLNTSESSRLSINAALRAIGLASRTIEVFADLYDADSAVA